MEICCDRLGIKKKLFSFVHVKSFDTLGLVKNVKLRDMYSLILLGNKTSFISFTRLETYQGTRDVVLS